MTTVIEALEIAEKNFVDFDFNLSYRQFGNAINFLEYGYQATDEMDMDAYLDVYGGIDNIPEM